MAVLVVLAVAVAAAQKPLRSSIEVTVVTATVRDADGKLVTGLPKEAFEIYEDGFFLDVFSGEVPMTSFGRHTYTVKAVDRSGNTSAPSNAIALDFGMSC